MIAVLTYAARHRKTQDLLTRLAAFGEKPVLVLATPWVTRKNFEPLVAHRPSEPGWPCEAWAIEPSDLCRNLGYEYRVVERDSLGDLLNRVRPEMVLIGGAGILPAEVVNATLVVNSHPAMLPNARGLDALKWAVYHGLPVGVTLHIIDQHPDAGVLVKQRAVPLYPTDTFHAFAMRQYEMEMDLLANAPELIRQMLADGPELEMAKLPRLSPDSESYQVYRRMPHAKEVSMLRRFEARRDQS